MLTAPGWRIARWAAGLVAFGLAAAYVAAVLARAHLEAPDPTPLLLDRSGRFLAQFPAPPRDGVPVLYGYWRLDAVPDRVTQATLAIEDHRFWTHPGVDGLAVLRAAWGRIGGGTRSGASTIAMQIARMQSPAPRTLVNKLLEAGTALVLTQRFERPALLRHYLRLVPYGNGSHGIAHAARWYLDKPVEDLSWAEVALLAAIPQAPARMNLWTPDGLERATARGRRILAALAARGLLEPDDLALAQAQLAAIRLPGRNRRPDAIAAALRVRDLIAADPAVAALAEPRIRTTLDLDVQATVTGIVRGQLATWRGAGADQAAVLVVDRSDGAVRAAVGSADYFGRHGGAIDFTRAWRSPGSTLKPFIFALGLERGALGAAHVLADLPDAAGGVANADHAFLGPLLPRQALANSRNVPATNLVRRVGVDPVYRFLAALGIHDQRRPPSDYGLSMAIGALPTTLERLVRAYTVLADDGRLGSLAWYDGQPHQAPRRLLSPEIARLVTLFLSDPMARLPSFPRLGPLEYPFPVALKTGTSQGDQDAWIVAYSDRWLVGAWMGRVDTPFVTDLSGARSAGRLARAVLLALHGTRPGDLGGRDFPLPERYQAAEICTQTGRRSSGGCSQTLREYFPPGHLPDAEPAQHRPPAIDRQFGDWAAANGLPIVAASALPSDRRVDVTIVSPESNLRLWRNPDAPPGLDSLMLKAHTAPGAAQVVWYVDGHPYQTAEPDHAIRWPLAAGTHEIQARLAFRPERSRPVIVTVE